MTTFQDRWLDVLNDVETRLDAIEPVQVAGRITKSRGLILEATGIQLPVGAVCLVELSASKARKAAPYEGRYAEAEVVGFEERTLYLMPLEQTDSLQQGARVFPLPGLAGGSGARKFPLGDAMLGRVVDGGGIPLDGKGPLINARYDILSTPELNPLARDPIHTQVDVGVRAINGLLAVGRGQRMGLFAGSGVGKSVLLGMMARFTDADVIVVGLIGERGREVQDFIVNILGEEGISRAVVVAAPADASPLKRLQGAAYATRLAEDYRDQGKNVLLIMDSLTRYAMAQREIGLAIGEAPATKGYPPSALAKLPKLVEKTGNGPAGGGSITAFYTVLTEGDDQQDPIADAARAILDGHIVLSRRLAEAGHYPAIDVEASISRVMHDITDPKQQRRAQTIKQLISEHQRNVDLINVGAYVPGTNATLDRAVHLYPLIERFLKQGINEQSDIQDTLATLIGIIR